MSGWAQRDAEAREAEADRADQSAARHAALVECAEALRETVRALKQVADHHGLVYWHGDALDAAISALARLDEVEGEK